VRIYHEDERHHITKTVLIRVHREKEILKDQEEDVLPRDFNEKGAMGLMTMKLMTSGSDTDSVI
jgi:hypothetical protein